MNNNNHTMDGYVREYREKLQSLEKIRDQHAEIHTRAERELSQIREKYEKTSKEINNMRKVITIMLDKGIDPVEAKLTAENYPNVESLWNNHHIYKDATDISQDYTFISDSYSAADITSEISFSITGDFGSSGSTT